MSVVFDGVGDYVDLGSLDVVEAQSALTVSLWVKVTTAADFKMLFGKQFSGTSRVTVQTGGSGIGDSNEVIVSVSNGSTCNGNTSGANLLTLNTWVHLALVFDGGGAANADRMKLYAGGVAKTLNFTGTAPATTPTDTAHAYLGGLTTTNNLTGKIAEVGIWQAALTSTQVGNLAGGDKPDTIATGLVFYAALKSDITDSQGATLTANGNAAIDADHPTMNGGGGGGGLSIPVAMSHYRQQGICGIAANDPARKPFVAVRLPALVDRFGRPLRKAA